MLIELSHAEFHPDSQWKHRHISNWPSCHVPISQLYLNHSAGMLSLQKFAVLAFPPLFTRDCFVLNSSHWLNCTAKGNHDGITQLHLNSFLAAEFNQCASKLKHIGTLKSNTWPALGQCDKLLWKLILEVFQVKLESRFSAEHRRKKTKKCD